jgi:penicillin G amidase
MTRAARRLTIAVLSAVLLVGLGLVCLRGAFAPGPDKTADLRGLRAAVTVRFDALGIPSVRADSREDAFAALGYVTARDRLFQMDLLRRQSAGTLAAILGAELLEADQKQRHYGMAQVADAIVARLPVQQRTVLEAYASGVNGWLARAAVLPLEFQLLGYTPSAWRPRDSVLIMLSMFQVLSDSEALERTRTIVQRSAPRLSSLLFAGSDPYTDALLGSPSSPATLPSSTVRMASSAAQSSGLSRRAGEAPVGSNGWAIAGRRTRDGRAVVANDMHLDLGVPNVWYRAELRYGQLFLAGLTLPGIPLLVTGSNGHVAWGLTNVEADVLDLVELELGSDPTTYRTARGWQRFGTRKETIAVRDAKPVQLRVQTTEWGPVLPKTLLGKRVALRWTALDERAVDLTLLELDAVRDVGSAVDVFNRAGMPPLNALLADERGKIAWTVTGRYPRRIGFSGADSTRWGDGGRGWQDYVAPAALPRALDPESGFVVNANQRMSRDDRVVLGHDYGHGYRAYRITELVARMTTASEADSLAIQLDTRSEPLELYRQTALEVLARSPEHSPLRAQAREALRAWDGKAELDSRGLALVRAIRRALVDAVYAGWLADCRAAEPGFELDFADVDTPLARALASRDSALLAGFEGGRDALVLRAIDDASALLARKFAGRRLAEIRWGDVSEVALPHPLGTLPGLGWLLDMPRRELAGCGQCVRMNSGALGASERMVVAPGREADGILHMPGGQSGSPLSAHYADQQDAWVRGEALPFLAGTALHTLTLLPTEQP